MSAPQSLSQSEFARHLGVGRSYVTALKKQGRLVLADDGKVLVAPSMESIAKTSGAPERAAVVTPNYSDAKERKEHYAAELARMDLEERIGKLMQADDVKAAIADAATTLRTRLESLPDQLAPQLAATSDEQQVRAMLADAVEMALGEMAEQFGKVSKA